MRFPENKFDCRCTFIIRDKEVELWRMALEISNLQLKLNTAVKSEDYQLAHDLKIKIEGLKADMRNQ